MIELTAWPPSCGSPSTSATLRPSPAAASAADVPVALEPTMQISTSTARAGPAVERRTVRVAVAGLRVEVTTAFLHGKHLPLPIALMRWGEGRGEGRQQTPRRASAPL